MKKGKCTISDWHWQKIAGFILVLVIVLPLLVATAVPFAMDWAEFDIESQALSGIVTCGDNGSTDEKLPLENFAVNWGNVRQRAYEKGPS
jgi:hypothetical protein